MTKDKIIESAYFDKGGYYFQAYSDLFSADVLLLIHAQENKLEDALTNKMLEGVNHFLNLQKSDLSWIKEELFKHYEMCIKTTSYAIVPDKLIAKYTTEEEANRNYFKIYNSEDAFKNAIVDYIYFDDFEDAKNIHYSIWMEIPWEIEHGITFHLKNGKLNLVE